jgi:hypothetical protein
MRQLPWDAASYDNGQKICGRESPIPQNVRQWGTTLLAGYAIRCKACSDFPDPPLSRDRPYYRPEETNDHADQPNPQAGHFCLLALAPIRTLSAAS